MEVRFGSLQRLARGLYSLLRALQLAARCFQASLGFLFLAAFLLRFPALASVIRRRRRAGDRRHSRQHSEAQWLRHFGKAASL